MLKLLVFELQRPQESIDPDFVHEVCKAIREARSHVDALPGRYFIYTATAKVPYTDESTGASCMGPEVLLARWDSSSSAPVPSDHEAQQIRSQTANNLLFAEKVSNKELFIKSVKVYMFCTGI
jgi:hypothetical protein